MGSDPGSRVGLFVWGLGFGDSGFRVRSAKSVYLDCGRHVRKFHDTSSGR